MACKGFVVSGLSSGSGKTVITLGLLNAFRKAGIAIAAAKSGPDYIDSAFLKAAASQSAINLDSHAMTPMLIDSLLDRHIKRQNAETLIVEGVMGLFDGTHNGRGSTADLACHLNLPVILVIDVRNTAQNAAALAAGLDHILRQHAKNHAKGTSNTHIAGLVLNHVGSPRHHTLIAEAMSHFDIPLIGSIPTTDDIDVPSRHLGLVQAADLAASGRLDSVIDAATKLVETHLDLNFIQKLSVPLALQASSQTALAVPAQHIAIASDAAFGFSYSHIIDEWAASGATISLFSPLNDEAPHDDAQFVYIPGGYPELHLPTLSNATHFMQGLKQFAARDIPIYGECGGFMVLGDAIIDTDGNRFVMAELLGLETSFAKRKLHLGYRTLTAKHSGLWNSKLATTLMAHEFHYTTATRTEGDALFDAKDAAGNDVGNMGLIKGSITGSYAHIIAAV